MSVFHLDGYQSPWWTSSWPSVAKATTGNCRCLCSNTFLPGFSTPCPIFLRSKIDKREILLSYSWKIKRIKKITFFYALNLLLIYLNWWFSLTEHSTSQVWTMQTLFWPNYYKFSIRWTTIQYKTEFFKHTHCTNSSGVGCRRWTDHLGITSK